MAAVDCDADHTHHHSTMEQSLQVAKTQKHLLFVSTETISSLRVGSFIQSQVYSTKADSCARKKGEGRGGQGRIGKGEGRDKLMPHIDVR